MSRERHTEVMDAILSTTAGSTVLATMHTLVGIQKFDKVIVIQDGQLLEHGSPGELLSNPRSMLNDLIRADSHKESGLGLDL